MLSGPTPRRPSRCASASARRSSAAYVISRSANDTAMAVGLRRAVAATISCRQFGGVVAEPGVVPHRLLTALGFGEQRQLRQARAGIGDDAAEQRREVPGHPLDRGVVEQVGVVLQRADQLAVLFAHQHHQVEGRTALTDVDGHQVKRRRAGVCACTARTVPETAQLFPRERDLEKRRMADITGRAKPLNEQREGVSPGARVRPGQSP